MTTKYVVVPYVRVSPDEVDDLEEFDNYDEAERELEHLSFLQGGLAEVVYRIEQTEVEESERVREERGFGEGKSEDWIDAEEVLEKTKERLKQRFINNCERNSNCGCGDCLERATEQADELMKILHEESVI